MGVRQRDGVNQTFGEPVVQAQEMDSNMSHVSTNSKAVSKVARSLSANLKGAEDKMDSPKTPFWASRVKKIARNLGKSEFL